MASQIDICNLALGRIGQQANVSSITPSDGSAAADFCASWYPIARDAMLEMHAWGFSTKRVNLAVLDGQAPDGWQFAYAFPTDAIKIWDVKLPADTPGGAFFNTDWWWRGSSPEFSVLNMVDNQDQQFVVESLADGTIAIYTNVQNAIAIYSCRITDTTKFPPLFVNALAWLLASYLAGPITKDPSVIQSAYSAFTTEGGKAMVSDSNGRRLNPYTNFTPDSIRARL